ncbi:MAG: substrate-binding domain-containing protein [Spirochaetales bacterium]|nr:substrate-binding domain-containing protein [Spirochaetales bacterium]
MFKRSLAIVLTMVIVCTAAFANGTQDSGAGSASQAVVPDGGHVEAVKAADEEIRIAFLSFQNNPFWFPIRDGAKAAGKYLKNYNATVDYIVMGDDLTADRVISSMEVAIAKEYDAIAVVPIFDGTEIVIDKATDLGIPVGSFIAAGSKPSKQLFFIGQDAYSAGQQCGQLIEEYTGGNGKVGVITGYFGATQHEQRMNGALDYLKGVDGIEIVGQYENRDKAEDAYNLTQDMITSNPDIKVIYVTAGGPFGAAKAVQDLGLTGKVGVVCYDHIPENISYVRSGEVIGAIDQDPFGVGFDTPVYLFNYLVAGDKPEENIAVNPTMLTPANVNEIYPE